MRPIPEVGTSRRRAAAFAVALLGFAAAPAAAERPGCGDGAPVDLVAAVKAKDGAVAHAWGVENLASVADADGHAFRVAYPAGSFSPGKSAVRGGAGFEFRGVAAPGACLSYKVRFPLGFDFAKGGKLPGLYGGDAPRGCIAKDAASGFSARLMWRAGGAGELYLYAPGREQRCGASIGRGTFAFVPGRWTEVTERISSGAAGGASVEVRIDGRLAVRADGLTLGAKGSSTVDGLLFSTFFGGDDASWATPRDQHADFADFRLTAAPQ
jgi:hypothetical protein